MLNSKIQKYSWLVVPLLFLMYSSPSALDYVFHFPDEKYYTDAVLQMMEKDDYFTPYQADGTPRFLKPIVTYWVLMGSYEIFGVSKISSRLFFWLAGALLVAITYFIAKSLSGNKKIGFTAAFITAANPLVLLSASRSIPDILLVLFLTISAWGFILIMISENRLKRYYWMAYLGAALAFETKGVPAAAFAGVSIIYLLFNPWEKVKFKNLVEPYSIIVSILIAISWFVIMYFKHGSVYLNTFYNDQVGGRVSSELIKMFSNFALSTLTLIAFFIPWIIIAFSKPKNFKLLVSASPKKDKALFGFIILWVFIIILMAGFVSKFYDRYLLPVIPLASVFLAYVLIKTTSPGKKTVLQVFLSLNLFIIIINLLYANFITTTGILIIGIVISMIFLIPYLLKVFRKILIEIVIANLVLLLFFNVFILLHTLLMPNQGEQLVQNLQINKIDKNDKVYVYGNIRTASNIRIHSNNKYNVVSMNTVFELPKEKNHFLVFDVKDKGLLELNDYIILPGSEEWSAVPVKKFPVFMQNTIRSIKNTGTTYLIAKRKDKP